MERTFSPMVRQFSAIAGLQQAYTLVAPEFGYRVLQYLCENGVQPEIWQDVVAELDAAQQTEQEGGAWRGQ